MNQQEAMNCIGAALQKVLKKDSLKFAMNTDLVGEKILDSLDRLVFLLELSELCWCFCWVMVSDCCVCLISLGLCLWMVEW